MAAITKFFSEDGGIAFSDRSMKIQIEDREPVIIPLDDVFSVRVIRPQEDADGSLCVDTVDGRRFSLLFEDYQYRDALKFKRMFDDLFEDDYNDEQQENTKIPMFQTSNTKNDKYDEKTEVRREYIGKQKTQKHFNWWYVLFAFLLFLLLLLIIA